jgi:sodium pump decarboxylase gamma subunit
MKSMRFYPENIKVRSIRMTIFEMLQQSAVLTVLGIFVVFVFLWVMIVFMNLSGKLFSSLESKEQQNIFSRQKTGESKTPETTAAIAAAVVEHQKR